MVYIDTKKNKLLLDYKGYFELIGSVSIGEKNKKQVLDFKILKILKIILMP